MTMRPAYIAPPWLRAGVAALACLAAAALANDGVGALGVGGVMTLGGTDAVAMRKEVLEIGTRRIDVAYEFVNESPQPVTLPVVFPLPEYGGLVEPDDDVRGGRPEGFSLSIDGAAQPFASHVGALLYPEDGGAPRDVTAELRALGLNEAQIALLPGAFSVGGKEVSTFDPARAPRARAVSPAQLDALRARGLLRPDPWLREPDTAAYPAWKVRVVHAWTHTFPPGRVVSVRHSYAPFLGKGITQSWLPGDGGDSARVLRETFCAASGLLRRLKRASVSPEKPVWGGTVNYILTTANTWKGPIREFVLRLKKSAAEESITLCFPGEFRKVDELTLEARLTDFVPAADLQIRYLATGRTGNRPPYVQLEAPRYGGVAPPGLGASAK